MARNRKNLLPGRLGLIWKSNGHNLEGVDCMYLDAFEDNKDCKVKNKTYAHGSEACNKQGLECKICIDGWWVDKIRGNGKLCPC